MYRLILAFAVASLFTASAVAQHGRGRPAGIGAGAGIGHSSTGISHSTAGPASARGARRSHLRHCSRIMTI